MFAQITIRFTSFPIFRRKTVTPEAMNRSNNVISELEQLIVLNFEHSEKFLQVQVLSTKREHIYK